MAWLSAVAACVMAATASQGALAGNGWDSSVKPAQEPGAASSPIDAQPRGGAADVTPPNAERATSAPAKDRVQKAAAKKSAPSTRGKSGGATTELPRATSITLTEDGAATLFTLGLTAGVRAEIYTLADPYRVIVDLPDLEFVINDMPGKKGERASGVVSDYRFGLFSAGKARVVIDTKGPVKVANAVMTEAPGKGAKRSNRIELRFRIEPVAASAFAPTAPSAGTAAKQAATAEATAKADAEAKETIAAADKRQSRSKRNRRPVVMIDPGHGGVDPGATGGADIYEKEIVLKVAKELARLLKASGHYDVHLTRDSDVFVSLDERVKASRDKAADLFISLHADAIGEADLVNRVRGASIYTLSDRASDEQARQMAEKENASDLIAGIETASTGEGDHVRDILIDLMARETANFSSRFSNLLAGGLGAVIKMSRSPQKSAAFKVLKQPHAPSVLVELGYISNADDRTQLTSAAWQKKAAQAIARSVAKFFKSATLAQQPENR